MSARGAVAVAVTTLLGCGSGERASDPATREGLSGVAGESGPLAAALAGRVTERATAPPPGPPRWPDDLRLHPDAPAESIELQAVLEDDDGALHVVHRRFDRLAVRSASDPSGGDGEDFGFRDVVRVSGSSVGAVATDDAPSPRRRDTIERATLGLADASEAGLRVRDAVLDLAPSSEPGRVSRDESVCAGRYTLGEGDGLALVFTREGCPSGSSAGALALATSPTLAVAGTLVVDGEPRAVGGRGWVRRAWGEPPAPGGAVVFDRLILELDGVGLLDVTRSRRRSGRGPAITTATLRRASASGTGSSPVTKDEVEWRDGGVGEEGAGTDDGSAGAIPKRWTLRVPEAGVDVTLEPPIDVPLVGDALGQARRGAVVASGSHAGIGFVELVNVGDAAAEVDP